MAFKLFLILSSILLLSLAFLSQKQGSRFNSGLPDNLVLIKPTLTPTALPTPLPTQKPKEPLLWGVFAGPTVNDFIDLQKRVSKKPDLLPIFLHWGNNNTLTGNFTQYATLQNQTLVIYWEAMDYTNPNPVDDKKYSYDSILAGEWDSYLKSFASDLKKYSHPVILVPFEEMNSDWYPWSVNKNGNTPQKHVEAYRYVHKFFKGINNVKFAWVVNHDDVPDTPENNPKKFYPGNAYVDYIGINGFNFSDPWQSFDQIFSAQLTNLKSISRPLLIFSMASAPGTQKAAWIEDTAAAIKKYPEIKGWIWFNENKERDWRIWSDSQSLNSFNRYLLTD